MPTFEEKLKAKYDAYAKTFRVEDLNDANDRSTLDILLKTEIMIDDLQEQIQLLMSDSAVENASNIKKLADLLRDATNTITTLQRTLAIDRKTRKTEETASVADYIRGLKRDAAGFMEQRIIKTYCPTCKVMVGRIYPVHDHTAFSVSFQCDQCNKLIRARREEQDILFDVKDAGWRKKHLADVVQPRKSKIIEYKDNEDDLVLNADPSMDVEIPVELEVRHTEDELILEGTSGTTETTN